jgi:signal transduction histidine kinase
MILNLAANAVKFTEQGWVHVAASYRVTGAETGVAEIAVSDSGVGIAKDKQELIFMPFTQVNFSDSRPAGGIGLGLAIVSEAARHLGGSVALQSQPGVGSTFTLKIPVEQAAHQPGWRNGSNPTTQKH